jgi:galactitol-specific phosphotransferase system IIB component
MTYGPGQKAATWPSEGRRTGSSAPDANNFLSARQQSAATRMAHRRLSWYHGPDWRRTGQTGSRLKRCIEALPPDVIQQLQTDAFGGFGLNRWSLSQLVDRIGSDMRYAGLYRMTWLRGTLHIVRARKLLASVVVEPEEQWAAGVATHNPTGTLDQAPPGALRILCVCSLGMATGVALRQKAERILRSLAVDAWLEVVPVAGDKSSACAEGRVAFADLVLLTRDEEDYVRRFAYHRNLIVVENWMPSREIRAALTRFLASPAGQRFANRHVAAPTPEIDRWESHPPDPAADPSPRLAAESSWQTARRPYQATIPNRPTDLPR